MGAHFFEAGRLGVSMHLLDKAVFGAEMLVAAVLLLFCVRLKPIQWWIPLLIIVQAGMIAWCEMGGEVPESGLPLYFDQFSIIMALIIGIIGSLICVYAISYMEDYHHHHTEMKDGRKGFFFIFFLFLAAMFGVVFCNNLIWLYLCWEITTLSSFLLIGYSKTDEARANAFRALGMNLIGGLGFAFAIVYLVKWSPMHTIELSQVISAATSGDAGWHGAALIVAILISFAGLAKAAQMPFSSWLLGAMVAPTPVSALLHSSTMVKAGVFVIVKFAPVLMGSWAGYLLACVGGITFLMTSIIAITQSNAKRVLAYSTIANLGLIVMCAGVGTPAAVWAAIMLIIFHAVAKALLFLGVGTIEHRIGSRDIEDMGGLIVSRPFLGLVMVIGMLGMFLAPFGMLISKWACLEALSTISTFPPILAVILAYGSAPTLFFWAKWMGKVVSVPTSPLKIAGVIGKDESVVLFLLAVMTVLASGLFPLGAKGAVEPYIGAVYGQATALSAGNVTIMVIMLGLMVLLPLSFLGRRREVQLVSTYLAGANIEGNATFLGSIGAKQQVGNRNYYLAGFLSERKLSTASIILSIAAIVAMFVAVSARAGCL